MKHAQNRRQRGRFDTQNTKSETYPRKTINFIYDFRRIDAVEFHLTIRVNKNEKQKVEERKREGSR